MNLKRRQFRFLFLFILFFSCIIGLEGETQLDRARQLKIELAKTQAPVEKARIMIKIAYQLVKLRPAEAIDYSRQAIVIAKELKDRSSQGYALIEMAHAQWYRQEINDAFKTIDEALALFEKSHNIPGRIDALSRLALLHRLDGNLDKSIQYCLEAIRLSEQIHDDNRLRNLYYDCGTYYHRMDDPDKAWEFYQKGLMQAEKARKPLLKAQIQNNLGLVLVSRKDYQQALIQYQEALAYFNRVKDDHWIALVEINIGSLYEAQNNHRLALVYFEKTLAYTQKIGDESWEAGILYTIALQHYAQDNLSQALEFTRKSLAKAEKNNRFEFIQTGYKLYADILTKTGKYAEANEYLRKYIQLKEKIINEEKNKEVARLQIRYEAEKKEKELLVLKIRSIILIAGLILIGLVLGVILYKFRHLFAFWKKQKYVGQYRLLESLGSGGMGTVYKAHPVRNRSQLVAIKILREELLTSDTQKKRFRREAQIIDQLNHPNILKIFERGEIDNKLYLVMEYVEGITLEKMIAQKGYLPLPQALPIMAQITGALEQIHLKGIIHRDLKPANIMLTRQGIKENLVKLLDFGLSRMSSQSHLTESGVLIGTMNYLAPEQILHSQHSQASDIYSLGIIFYEMLAGIKAFAGDNFTDIIYQVINGTPKPIHTIRLDVPQDMEQLIQKMIDKDSTLRPSLETIKGSLLKLI